MSIISVSIESLDNLPVRQTYNSSSLLQRFWNKPPILGILKDVGLFLSIYYR